MCKSTFAFILAALMLLSAALAGHALREMVEGTGSAAQVAVLCIAVACAGAGCYLASHRPDPEKRDRTGCDGR